jgi:type II secretory pathway pseudopilin PulG
MRQNNTLKNKDSFTLVELLVVIGILAILTAAVVVILNPAELLKQSRDSKRTTDLANLNNAIKLLLTQNPDVNLGSASTVYLSLADPSSTCGSYSLPALSSGWKYHCSASADYQKADGSGWMPVSFAAAGAAASLSSLPVDPQNSATGGLYYTYVPGGSWALTALMESEKGAKAAISDGGMMPGVLERGTDLSLTPGLRDRGLVGYWPLDESSGTLTADRSGNGNTGTLMNGPVWQGSASCKVGGCLNFDGGNDYVDVGASPSLLSQDMTIAAWVKPASILQWAGVLSNMRGWGTGFSLQVGTDNRIAAMTSGIYVTSIQTPSAGTWYHIVATHSASNTVKLYVNGALEKESTKTVSFDADAKTYIGVFYTSPSLSFYGNIDDVRIYNRVLSADEVQAIYNATK